MKNIKLRLKYLMKDIKSAFSHFHIELYLEIIVMITDVLIPLLTNATIDTSMLKR